MNYDKLPYLMTRQEVADLIGVCSRTIYNKEHELGITQARIKWMSQRVRYRRDFVINQFQKLGYLPTHHAQDKYGCPNCHGEGLAFERCDCCGAEPEKK